MEGEIIQLRVVLKDAHLPIWRRLHVLLDMTLRDLHDVIQIAMGWDGDHLHQFVLRTPRRRRDPEAIPQGSRLGDFNAAWELEQAADGRRFFVPCDDMFCRGLHGR